MKSYRLKECFLTLCGEGANAGRPAVFVRFAFCNGWNGLESGRASGPFGCSAWCDTDFVGTDGTGGGEYTATGLADVASDLWPDGARLNHGLTHGLAPLCVLTGGEPMLQIDQQVISALHANNFEVAVETNGTRPVPLSVDWITVSPKAGAELVQRIGQELKLVYPQPGAEPERFEELDFRHHYLQPMDGPFRAANTRAAVDYCLAHPKWRLSLQTHKTLGLR